MMEAYEQETPTTPAFPDIKTLELRKDLIWEEWNEFLDAVHDNDLVEAADAIVDMLVVTVGAGVAFGLPVQKLWDEVLRSNMSKVDPVLGHIIKSEKGKVLKPDTFVKPDIKGILEQELVDKE